MSAPTLRLSGRLRFDGRAVFGPLEATFPAGRWTAVLGRSGCGKSSLLRCLAGLIGAPDFDGTICASDGAPVAGRVALMAQSDLLLPWASVAQNAALGARLRGEKPDEARLAAILASVGLAERAGALPAALSGGMRQRAALARTLMEDRPVVLLDEPFSALDAVTRDAMQNLAVERLAGKTAVIVTHDPLEAARLGDAVYVMEPAALHAPFTPETPSPRPVDAPQTLRLAADLARWMKDRAAP